MLTRRYLDSMKKFFIFCLLLSLLSCGGGKKLNVPEGFDNFSDNDKAEWLIKNFTPELVAQYLCEDGAKLDSTLNIKDFKATVNIIYNKYEKDNKASFGNSMNEFAASLPSKNKMTLYMVSAGNNAYSLGFAYGNDFLGNGEKDFSIINEDYESLKEITNNNPKETDNFVKGLNAAFSKKGESWQPSTKQ